MLQNPLPFRISYFSNLPLGGKNFPLTCNAADIQGKSVGVLVRKPDHDLPPVFLIGQEAISLVHCGTAFQRDIFPISLMSGGLAKSLSLTCGTIGMNVISTCYWRVTVRITGSGCVLDTKKPASVHHYFQT